MNSNDSDSRFTSEQFLSLLQAKATSAFATAVANWRDSDRRKLSKTAQEHLKATRKTKRRDWFFVPSHDGAMARLGGSRISGCSGHAFVTGWASS